MHYLITRNGYHKMTFTIISAVDKEGGIGYRNRLPWKIPSEISWFRQKTTSGVTNAVIMGSATWKSLDCKPLCHRMNIILSSNLISSGIVTVCKSLSDALIHCKNHEISNIWVIGGGKVYQEAITSASCKEIILSRIDGTYNTDTVFPTIPSTFRLTNIAKMGNAFDQPSWNLEVYRREEDPLTSNEATV